MIRLLSVFCLCLGLETGSTPTSALLVLEKAQNTLLIVDPVALKIVGRVPAGNDPHKIVVGEDGRSNLTVIASDGSFTNPTISGNNITLNENGFVVIYRRQ